LAGRPDAVITGDTATWRRVAAEPRLAVDAYLDGRLTGAATCTSASGSSRRPARRKDRCGCAFAPSPHAARACRWRRPEKGRRRGIDLLDALELDRAHLIGNSLGGRVALEIALRDPDRVGRLALLAPALAWRAPTPMGAAAAPDPT
jgi:pimeloyl-ACP methyl ester carboxylesterase